MDLAIRPDATEFDREVAARIEGVAESRLQAKPVITVDAFQHVDIAQRLIGRAAEHRLAGVGAQQGPAGEIELPGAEMSCQQRRAQSRLALMQLRHPRPCLILALAPLQRGARDTHEGRRVERPFQQRHVAEDVGQAGRRRVAFRAAAALGEHDERQVGPARLARDPVGDGAEIRGRHRLLGQHRETDGVVHQARKLAEAAADPRGDPGRLQQAPCHERIPPKRRQDDRLGGRGLPRHGPTRPLPTTGYWGQGG